MSILGAALLAALLLAVVVAVWLARHPEPIRAAGWRIAGSSPLHRFATLVRGRGCAASLARRMGVEPAAGLVLLLGLLGVAALGVVFTYLLDGVLDGEGVAHLDQPVSKWLAAHRERWLTVALRRITQMGSPTALGALGIGVGVVALLTARSWVPVVLEVICAGGIGLLILGVKTLVGRPRPPHPYALLTQAGWSFPSGHAAGAAAIALFSAWGLSRWAVRGWTAQVAVWTVALLLVAVVGLSRIYLGVHYVSDVFAGWVLGALWAGTVALTGAWWHSLKGRSRRGGRQGDAPVKPGSSA